MLKFRIIPCLLIKNGLIVQSKFFKRHQVIGNPSTSVKRLSTWAADELIYIDISRDESYDLKRDDLNHPSHKSFFEIVKEISKYAFMPLTVGGKIRTLEDIRLILNAGADKVTINTEAIENPEFIRQAARNFGSQCIVVSIDVDINENNSYEVKSHFGKKWTSLNPIDWAKEVEKLGAGEILLNSVQRDGTKKGYDINLIKSVISSTEIPVIALGGVGEWQDFANALDNGISAVSAANIFHHTEQSVFNAKKYLYENGYNVRFPEIIE